MKRNWLNYLLLLALIGTACNNERSPASNADRAAAVPVPDTAGIVDETGARADWALLPFVKPDSVNPVLTPGKGRFTDPIRRHEVAWEDKDVFNPAVVIKDDRLYLLYRAQDKIGRPAGTSRIGLAISDDGLHFTRSAAPVLYPAIDAQKPVEWEGGCEDPRVVEDDNRTYYLTYTAFDGHEARLLIATSTDLQHWKKHGEVFGTAYHGKIQRALVKIRLHRQPVWIAAGSFASPRCREVLECIGAIRISGRRLPMT